MAVGEHQPPVSEETPPHARDEEFLEGLRDEELPEHYSPRPDDWRKRRESAVAYPFPQPPERQR